MSSTIQGKHIGKINLLINKKQKSADMVTLLKMQII